MAVEAFISEAPVEAFHDRVLFWLAWFDEAESDHLVRSPLVKDPTGDFQLYDPITASNAVCFDQVPIGSNAEHKLDLSIQPGADLPADIYTGTMTLNGWSSSTCSL